MFFRLLPERRGQAVIGRMTESLIGAVGLKEFVFGTSFLSVSLKDQDSSEAAPSSSLAVSLCRPPLAGFPLSPVSLAALARLLGPVCLCLRFSRFLGRPHRPCRPSSAARCRQVRPRQNL